MKVGMKADLTVLDTTGASWCPMTNPEVNIVFSGHGSDVVLTMCDGEVVYRDGVCPGVDLEQVKAEVAARTKRIISGSKANGSQSGSAPLIARRALLLFSGSVRPSCQWVESPNPGARRQAGGPPLALFLLRLTASLVSSRDFPAVSGAMKMDNTNPKDHGSPAATSMVGPMPKLARKIGVAYVATIVPTREMPTTAATVAPKYHAAETMPMDIARWCLGVNSVMSEVAMG